MKTTPNDTLEAAAAWAAACLVRDKAFAAFQAAYAVNPISRTVDALFEAHNHACDDVTAARIVFERFTARDSRRRRFAACGRPVRRA